LRIRARRERCRGCGSNGQFQKVTTLHSRLPAAGGRHHSCLSDDGAERERCRDVRENSDARTASLAERMINLSNSAANEDGIFLHADVKAARVRSQDPGRNKKRENNPMHSSRGVRKQSLTPNPKSI
jgi:hypothetical protein